MQTCQTCVAAMLILVSSALAAPVDRIMTQDSTLNNLQHRDGYVTCPSGTLGGLKKSGTGKIPLILIPGLGFGSDIFDDFVKSHESEYSFYAVTLPGFGGTQAPPMPPPGTSMGEETWTRGALEALVRQITQEHLEHVVVLGHWLGGTQIALWMALEHPQLVSGVIIVSGSTRFTPLDTTQMPYHPALERRIKGVDQYLVPRWFKTVTRETWDDNNFLPGDYATNPILGLRLWREAASPELPVWVRYLNEFNAQDVSLSLDSLRVPTLVLKPGLDGLEFEPDQNYMEAYCLLGWDGAALTNPKIRMETLPHSRACMWLDQPELFGTAVSTFVSSLQKH